MSSTSAKESKALRLARYLKEFVGLRTTTIRDVAKYDEVIWFCEMPQDHGCVSPAWSDGEGSGSWLEVRKQHLPRRPEPPAILLPWLDEKELRTASEDAPALSPTMFAPDSSAPVDDNEEPPLIQHQLVDHPEVVTSYEAYRATWLDWAGKYRKKAAIQELYATLFRLHTQLRKEGEIVELVLGLGLLEWRPLIAGKPIATRRHVVTAQVDLRFDPGAGVMRLEGLTNSARLKLEDDMLEAELRPIRDQYASMEEMLEAVGDSVWDKGLMVQALQFWSGALHPDTQWSTDLHPQEGTSDKPLLTLAPALILRRRGHVGMVRIYEELIRQLSGDSASAPAGWNGLVEDVDDLIEEVQAEDGSPDSAQSSPEPGEVFFPLPANREQRRIVNAIDRRRGILVQGPPGTGKSHTIANLVCHLLATGKRVLITAETGRALQVLKEKLPRDIQPLCISMLGQDSNAFSELNKSIQGITARQAEYSRGAYDYRITELQNDLDKARRWIAEIDSKLLSLRSDETAEHRLANGAYVGTASKIAQRVAAEKDQYEWLSLRDDAEDIPPVSNEDMAEWLAARRRYDKNAISTISKRIVPSSDVIDATAFAGLVSMETHARVAVDAVSRNLEHPARPAIASLSLDARRALREELGQVERQRLALRLDTESCFRRAARETLAGRNAVWDALYERSLELLNEIEELYKACGKHQITIKTGLDHRVVRTNAATAERFLRAGGKWKKLGLITPGPLKGLDYLRRDVLVDGQGADNPGRLNLVSKQIDVDVALMSLEKLWADHGQLPGGTQLGIRVIALREHLVALMASLDFARMCTQCQRLIATESHPVASPDWLGGEANMWIAVLNAVELIEKWQRATAQVEQPLAVLNATAALHDAHPVVGRLALAVRQRDIGAFSVGLEELRTIEKERLALARAGATEKLLLPKVRPLVDQVLAAVHDSDWDSRLGKWSQAWAWCVANNWLKQRGNQSYHQYLADQRRTNESRVSNYLAESASLRAWKYFFGRLSPRESAALKGWREAVRAMGKATGRSAKLERLRREAREYMDTCRDAIPVWIMPRYLVAEMLTPAPDRYDIVIVDEASQLGIESLFLFYIARKMVVVGDDQQISPYGVGIADEQVASLQRHYLTGVPNTVALSAQSSLYANAKIRFSETIVLREHFRCMPEIIQFSNDLCYANNGTPLDPLRAYPANRLNPLVLRHVEDGYRIGSANNAQNQPEADAIVAQVLACVNDRRYTGRSMGVISLQGEAQAKLIQKKLLEHLPPEVIEERRLICGDAYAFQGDERHVMFLSLVAAPGETRIGVLSNESARQRFNVAASRAQDQMWLFHSVTVNELSNVCMRHKLLSYMQDPSREPTREVEQTFESQFEREVYSTITARGYHVRTQVRVGDPVSHSYRIDLVVEGMQGRLAVECDGDEWHGPDRYERDMARQRDLERAGWQFVRIRGGDFYRDPEAAVQPLWRELDRLGIKSGGIDVSAGAPPPPADLDEIALADAPLEEQEAPIAGAARRDHLLEEEEPDDERGRRQAAVPYRAAAWRPAPQQPTRDPRPTPMPAPLKTSGGVMAPYIEFSGRCADPRTANAMAIAQGLREIVAVEGPVTVKRAYAVYLRSCGIHRLGHEIRKSLNKGLALGIRQGNIVGVSEGSESGYGSSVLRLPRTPAVSVRQRGPRVFDEIPPSELFVVGQELASKHGVRVGSDDHLRAVLDRFDLVRLTTQVGVSLLKSLNRDYPHVDQPGK